MSVVLRTEDYYLILSRKKECQRILALERISNNDKIDFYIALHIVLEVGLNTLFREISLRSIKKNINLQEITKNIDNVSFLDKVTLFIYNSNFEIKDENDLNNATHYHSVINCIKSFSHYRNIFLHGHSISTVQYPNNHEINNTFHSKAKKILDKDIQEQIDMYSFILEGICFYVDHLQDSERSKYITDYILKTIMENSFLKRGL
jgi:hypothetical protein